MNSQSKLVTTDPDEDAMFNTKPMSMNASYGKFVIKALYALTVGCFAFLIYLLVAFPQQP